MKEGWTIVRDHAPTWARANGRNFEFASPIKRSGLLDAKIDEELAEYRMSLEVEELVDLIEVIYALAWERHGVDNHDLEKLRQEKADERGRFVLGVIMERK